MEDINFAPIWSAELSANFQTKAQFREGKIMTRGRYATDAAVAAAAAATAVATVTGAVPVVSEGATDLDVFSAAAVVDIAAIKTELSALRVKLGF